MKVQWSGLVENEKERKTKAISSLDPFDWGDLEDKEPLSKLDAKNNKGERADASVTFSFGEGYTPKTFGGLGWDIVHPLSFQNEGNSVTQEQFVIRFLQNIMCFLCFNHAQSFLKENNYMEFVKISSAPSSHSSSPIPGEDICPRWWWKLHNFANKNAGKKEVSFEVCKKNWKQCTPMFYIPALFEFLSLAITHQLSPISKVVGVTTPTRDEITSLPVYRLVKFLAHRAYLPASTLECVQDLKELLQSSPLCSRATYLPITNNSKALRALEDIQIAWFSKHVSKNLPIKSLSEKKDFYKKLLASEKHLQF